MSTSASNFMTRRGKLNAMRANRTTGVESLSAVPELRRNSANNQCRSNEVDGILFQNGAHGKAESNVCERNKDSGISVIGSGAAPELANNQCRSNANAGIYFDSGSNGKAESNTCEGNASSGIIVNASFPCLSGNRLLNNAQYGLVYDRVLKANFSRQE